MNVVRTLRNNWKKSVVFTGVAVYGVNYGHRKYNESVVLKAYCLEAKKYGDVTVKNGRDRPRKVTVFLNPAAHKGKAKSLFEKNVAPLLHLAGLEVNLVLTEYEGQAKKYMDVLDNTDAIIVAGGNGTLSEVVTGLLRRADEEQFSRIPLGVLPLGYTNTTAKSLCPPVASETALMNEMAMSIIRGNMKSADVIHIKGEDDKSVYAVHSVDWGSYSDTYLRKKKYWYFGPLRDYLSLVVSSLRYWPAWADASVTYVNPCVGCSSCYVPPPPQQWKWWHLLISPQRTAVTGKDYSKVINEDCGCQHTENLTTAQISLRTDNSLQPKPQDEGHSMTLNVSPGNLTRTEYIKYGQMLNKSLKDGEVSSESYAANERSIKVREVTLRPTVIQVRSEDDGGKTRSRTPGDLWFLIDQEQFEVKPITCRLLPNKLHFFFSDSFTVPLDRTTGRLLKSSASI